MARLQASFILSALPEADLPSVMLQFELDAEEWEDYDFGKGAYAAKEQAFSVPIRSGLDWRRSVYVTCW